MDVHNLNRRRFFGQLGMGAVAGLVAGQGLRAQLAPGLPPAASAPGAFGRAPVSLPPIRATRDRIIKENVGLRPFRKTGPNRAVETIAGKTVVHNYGHGGSGWSLSWGSAAEARDKALATGAREFAVIGCGAVGLTSAILLQRTGSKVTIYTKDRHPHITSTMATGVWSPDSRICLEEHGTGHFGAWWEQTARASFAAYQHLLGLPGDPVEWTDSYSASWKTAEQREAARAAEPGPHFAHFRERVTDLTPDSFDLEPTAHPFAEPYVRKGTSMIFNISAYTDYLIGQFTQVGGRIATKTLHTPADFGTLAEPTVVNCTGLGSQALLGDTQLVPVWGQMTFLVPQPEVRYRFSNDDAYAIPRRDGIALACLGNGRYGETEARSDRAHSFQAIDGIAASMQALRA